MLNEQKKPKEKPAAPILSPEERKEAVALFKGDAGALVRAERAGREPYFTLVMCILILSVFNDVHPY